MIPPDDQPISEPFDVPITVSLRGALGTYQAAETPAERQNANELIGAALKQRHWEWTASE
ncbi:MAG: hypothetical protein ABIX28_02410 [Vicinamibacterales bacterium]